MSRGLPDFYCSCGKTFRSMSAEARHRHNFPALCRKPRRRKPLTETCNIYVDGVLVASGVKAVFTPGDEVCIDAVTEPRP